MPSRPELVTALFSAVRREDLTEVVRALDMGADVRALKSGLYGPETVLFRLVDHRSNEVMAHLWRLGVEDLLEHRNKEQMTALHYNVGMGGDVAARWLIEHGANVHAEDIAGDTVLHWAARKGRTQIVQRLMGKDVDLFKGNHKGQTAMALALENGHADSARLLEHAMLSTVAPPCLSVMHPRPRL